MVNFQVHPITSNLATKNSGVELTVRSRTEIQFNERDEKEVSIQVNNEKEAATGAGLVRAILSESQLRATSFIVTIYGDVVEPRGGVTWIGSLIETCAGVGISETLVRTAVSRLMLAGQLAGEREGRRSFYRLTPPARAEFAAAARVLFGPPESSDWHFVQLTGPSPDSGMQMLENSGHARLGQRLAVGVRPLPALPTPALVFRAEIAGGDGDLRAFAADYWNLAPHAQAYMTFLRRFAPLAEFIEMGGRMAAVDCLTARLLLVHQFRSVALRDPRLPPDALPADWPADAARHLFARLYCHLSSRADAHIAKNFTTTTGPLPKTSEFTVHRLMTLCGSIGAPAPSSAAQRSL